MNIKINKDLINGTNNEIKRENNGIGLITSENYVPNAILKIQGYSNKRYYDGREFIDNIEAELCRKNE